MSLAAVYGSKQLLTSDYEGIFLVTRFSVLVAGLFLAVSAAGIQADSTGLVVSDAWIPEAPPMAKALAGYMVLQNHSDQERVLLSASSPNNFDAIMLHRTVVEGDIAKMVYQPMITVPANSDLVFEPNSYHLMLIRPLKRFKAGDKVNITLRFRNGESRDVIYQVRSLFD